MSLRCLSHSLARLGRKSLGGSAKRSLGVPGKRSLVTSISPEVTAFLATNTTKVHMIIIANSINSIIIKFS